MSYLLADIQTQEVEKSGYDRWLGKIHHFMQKDEDISACYQLQNITAHGLQFIFEGVDMNLLLSPHWSRPGDYFKYLSCISPALRFRWNVRAYIFDIMLLWGSSYDISDSDCDTMLCVFSNRFSASAAKWQVQFFKQQSSQVTTLTMY